MNRNGAAIFCMIIPSSREWGVVGSFSGSLADLNLKEERGRIGAVYHIAHLNGLEAWRNIVPAHVAGAGEGRSERADGQVGNVHTWEKDREIARRKPIALLSARTRWYHKPGIEESSAEAHVLRRLMTKRGNRAQCLGSARTADTGRTSRNRVESSSAIIARRVAESQEACCQSMRRLSQNS
jgi:hypothetical protein